MDVAVCFCNFCLVQLLITVVQLSAPDAPFLGHLCEEKNLAQLLEAAFMDVPEESSSAADVALASISVLESLISRLCETTNPFEAMQVAMQHPDDAPHEKSASQLAAIQSVSTLLVQHVPKLCNQLQRYVENDPLGSITLQTKESTPRLGQKGLQLVKLVEATIRLGVPELDSALCKTGALRACLDLFFKYQLNSLLHLSVQRIVLMVLEGGQARRQTQRHLLVECKLLERVLNMLSKRKVKLARTNFEFAAGLIPRNTFLCFVFGLPQAATASGAAEAATPDLWAPDRG